MTAPTADPILVDSTTVYGVTVELVDATTLVGVYTIYITCDEGELAVDETHERTARNRYGHVVTLLQAGRSFGWLRQLHLIFQPAEEASCP